MKVLVIAYACEPDSISESFLSFETACGLAERYSCEIHVLTRSNNLEACRAHQRSRVLKNLMWHGCEANRFWLWLKSSLPVFSIQAYVPAWQLAAAREARNLVDQYDIKLVHGLSMMSLHNYAAGLVGIPSITGPVGGAQVVPAACLRFSNILEEVARWLSIQLTPLLPGWKSSVLSASRIICANTETAEYMTRHGVMAEKIVLRQPGYPGVGEVNIAPSPPCEADPSPCRIFWGGRLTKAKGLAVLLEAVAKVRESGRELQVHVTGDGPARPFFRRLANKLAVKDIVTFHGWLPFKDMIALRNSCHLLTFTSLRETTGLALMEMLLSGRPVAVLNCGGPKGIAHGLPCFLLNANYPLRDLTAVINEVSDNVRRADKPMSKMQVSTNRFCWENYLKDLFALYCRVAKEDA
jgi:glycosyltransferase involved in cell wall biosynthesis